MYNGVLVAVVLACYFVTPKTSRVPITLDTALLVFLLAVLANVAYCAAYIVDVFAQLSALRERWKSYRWILLWIGIAFAAILTRFFALGLFALGG